MVFLSLKYNVGKYFKIGHGVFVLYPLQLMVGTHTDIQCHITYITEKVLLNKSRINRSFERHEVM
jgi:hypothetical protein